MATERVEVARLKVKLTGSEEMDNVRHIVSVVKACRRNVEADFDGTSIIFRAYWPKSGTHKERKP